MERELKQLKIYLNLLQHSSMFQNAQVSSLTLNWRDFFGMVFVKAFEFFIKFLAI